MNEEREREEKKRESEKNGSTVALRVNYESVFEMGFGKVALVPLSYYVAVRCLN